jgi:hypothetical protein
MLVLLVVAVVAGRILDGARRWLTGTEATTCRDLLTGVVAVVLWPPMAVLYVVAGMPWHLAEAVRAVRGESAGNGSTHVVEKEHGE